MRSLSYLDSIKKLNEVFEKHNRIVFPRFGDADFIMMTKEKGQIGRANKNQCSPTTKKLMEDSFDIDGNDVVVGIAFNIDGDKNIGDNVPGEFKSLDIEKHNEFVAWSLFQHSFFKHPDEFEKFFHKLKSKTYIFIGNYYNKQLDRFYGKNVGFVQTPMYDSINSVDDNISKLVKEIDEKKPNTIILSCGQLARVICKRLHKQYPTTNFIDVGSLSDMFIVNQPEFKDIPKRSHIQHQLQQIKEKVKFYESRINNNNS